MSGAFTLNSAIEAIKQLQQAPDGLLFIKPTKVMFKTGDFAMKPTANTEEIKKQLAGKAKVQSYGGDPKKAPKK